MAKGPRIVLVRALTRPLPPRSPTLADHAVWNLGPRGSLTTSINHNWLPAAGLAGAWAFLAEELAAVRRAIGDELAGGSGTAGGLGGSMAPLEWERQCQVILRANAALNVDEFVTALLWRARALLSCLGRAAGVSETAVVTSVPTVDVPVYAAPRAASLRSSAAAAAALRAIRGVLAAVVKDPYVAMRPPLPAEVPVHPAVSPEALGALRARMAADSDDAAPSLPWHWTAETILEALADIDALVL